MVNSTQDAVAGSYFVDGAYYPVHAVSFFRKAGSVL
jgi:hypothetical protein